MKKITSLCIMVALLSLCTVAIFSQQRGMKIIASDKSGVPREIPLYTKSYAVIIGIDRYKNLDYNLQLKNAVNDAKGVQKVLEDRYQFDQFYTLFNEQATKDNILKTLQGDLAGAGKDDAIFVFFAGHGYTQTTQFGDEVGYIVPHDGSMKDNEMYKNISMVELRDNIAKTLKAKHIFFVMDACYSGTLLRRGSATKEQAVDYEYLKTITETPVRQVLTAGGKNEQVLDGGYKNHSIFTGRLIEKLEKAENYITASELGAYVPKKVIIDASDRNHKQNPQFGYLLGEGDFVFITKSLQKVSSEEVLVQELKRLQEENARLDKAKKEKELQENQKRQEELKRQIALLEEKRKLEQMEKARREEEQRKALEEEKRKKELLAKIEIEKKKQISSYAEEFSYKKALKKIAILKTKITQLEKEYNEQKAAAIRLAIGDTSRGEFETRKDYEQRLHLNRIKIKQISYEYDSLEAVNKKIYTDEINYLTERKYSFSRDQLAIKLGKYDIDNQLFPVSIKLTTDPCNKTPIYIDSKIYISPEEAKILKENELFLETEATVIVHADETVIIDQIVITNAVNQKQYEFIVNAPIPIEETTYKYGFFTDPRDGKVYRFLRIGGQTWMVDNLNYNAGNGTFCYEDKHTHCSEYGKLYNWDAAKRAVPAGWRLPGKADFERLLEYMDCRGNLYSQLIDTTGFHVLFGGWRDFDGNYIFTGSNANFWTSSENGSQDAWYLGVVRNRQKAGLFYTKKNNAFSVRCVKD